MFVVWTDKTNYLIEETDNVMLNVYMVCKNLLLTAEAGVGVGMLL